MPFRADYEIVNPFGKEAFSLPDSLLLRIDMSNSPDHLVHDRSYFTTPIWDNPAERITSLSIIPASAGPFPETDDEVVPKAKADRVVFPTEAGIDIYLYYTDQGFQVFWPKEEP